MVSFNYYGIKAPKHLRPNMYFSTKGHFLHHGGILAKFRDIETVLMKRFGGILDTKYFTSHRTDPTTDMIYPDFHSSVNPVIKYL